MSSCVFVEHFWRKKICRNCGNSVEQHSLPPPAHPQRAVALPRPAVESRPRAGTVRAFASTYEALDAKVKRLTANPDEKKTRVTDRATREMVLKAVKKSILFKDVEERMQNMVVDAMWLEEVKAATQFIKQGDRGETFYVINNGTFDVLVKGNHVSSQGPGTSFGELALLSHELRRRATVQADTDAAVWTVDRTRARLILAVVSIEKLREYEHFLEQVQAFSVLFDSERRKLAEALDVEVFSDGQRVFAEGDAGDTFYLLKKGEVVFTVKEGGLEVEVARYTEPGDYFGELSLRHAVPRAATVTAVGAVECLTLRKDQFTMLLGSMEDIFQSRVMGYQHQAHQARTRSRSVVPVEAQTKPLLPSLGTGTGTGTSSPSSGAGAGVGAAALTPSFSSTPSSSAASSAGAPSPLTLLSPASSTASGSPSAASAGAGAGAGGAVMIMARSPPTSPRGSRAMSPATPSTPDSGRKSTTSSPTSGPPLLSRLPSLRTTPGRPTSPVPSPNGDKPGLSRPNSVTFRGLNRGSTSSNSSTILNSPMSNSPLAFANGGGGGGGHTNSMSFRGERGSLSTPSKERSDSKSNSPPRHMMMEREKEAKKRSALMGTVGMGDLTIIGTLGKGAFAHVQLVVDRSGQTHALKTVSKALVLQTQQVNQISSEKIVLSTLSHPFITNLRGTFKDDTHLHFLLEPCLGGEVAKILRERTRLTEDSTRFVCASVVLIFEYLHKNGVVYRDLKPENLLLDNEGYVKLADFGFAKIIDERRTHTLCGTADYMAPEIVSGQGHGLAVDWWTLGILIFELLCGDPPFYHEDPLVTYEKIMAGNVKYPASMSKEAIDLVSRLLVRATQRLGAIKGGVETIKEHPWFTGVDWAALQDKRVKSPLVVTVKSDKDLSNCGNRVDDDDDLSPAMDPSLKPADGSDPFANF